MDHAGDGWLLFGVEVLFGFCRGSCDPLAAAFYGDFDFAGAGELVGVGGALGALKPFCERLRQAFYGTELNGGEADGTSAEGGLAVIVAGVA